MRGEGGGGEMLLGVVPQWGPEGFQARRVDLYVRGGGGGAGEAMARGTGSPSSGLDVGGAGSPGGEGGGGGDEVCTPGVGRGGRDGSSLAVSSAARSTPETAGSADETPRKRPRRGIRNGAAGEAGVGLRQFSYKVCEKVKEKRRTTYNEVADELVNEFAAAGIIKGRGPGASAGGGTPLSPASSAASVGAMGGREGVNSAWRGREASPVAGGGSGDGANMEGQYDEKNIRRRVYDALNVLMAMDVIYKEKKAITWRGMPSSNETDVLQLNQEGQSRTDCIVKKRAYLRNLMQQHIAYKNLIDRNAGREPELAQTAFSSGAEGALPCPGVLCPFVVTSADKEAIVEIILGNEMQDVSIDFFEEPFAIEDDLAILQAMGMQEVSEEQYERLLPAEILPYASDILGDVLPDDGQDDVKDEGLDA